MPSLARRSSLTTPAKPPLDEKKSACTSPVLPKMPRPASFNRASKGQGGEEDGAGKNGILKPDGAGKNGILTGVSTTAMAIASSTIVMFAYLIRRIVSLQNEVSDIQTSNNELAHLSKRLQDQADEARKAVFSNLGETSFEEWKNKAVFVLCKGEEEEQPADVDSSSNTFLILFLLICLMILAVIAYECHSARKKAAEHVNVTFWEVFSFRLDYVFSTSQASKPIALLGATLLLIMFGGIILWLQDPSQSLSSTVFFSWLLIADTSAHSDIENGRAVGLFMTVGGMLVFGFMIGIVTDVISEKVDHLKKGKSRVIERGHTLVLGWSDKTIPILLELANANESEGGRPIVLLANREKQEMEVELFSGDLDYRGSTIIVRSGHPILQSDLRKVSATTARAIVVLADPTVTADESDAMVLRVVLALMGFKKLAGHVVCEICDVDNTELVQLVGRSKVETVVAHDMIGRLMIQCARQPGLALILESLLGFDGSEFYMKEWPSLVGQCYDRVIYFFADAVVLGLKRANGTIVINPPEGVIIENGDMLLVLAEDDNTYQPVAPSEGSLQSWLAEGKAVRNIAEPPPPGREKLLFIGWRRDLDDMIMELDTYVPPKSQLTLFSTRDIDLRLKSLEEGGLDVKQLKNVELVHACGSPLSRHHLERLPTPLEEFDSILILADDLDSDQHDMAASDSRSIATLLLIRDIRMQRQHERWEKKISNVKAQREQKVLEERQRMILMAKGQNPSLAAPVVAPTMPITPSATATAQRRASWSDEFILKLNSDIVQEVENRKSMQLQRDTTVISEILDPKTKDLIFQASYGDYVASNELVSKAIAMVAENQEINLILSELLSAFGNETYVRDAELYATPGSKVSFYSLTARARARKEVAIGYVLNSGLNKGVFLNPPNKAQPIHLGPGDKVVVIAE
eukprot:g51966.t1